MTYIFAFLVCCAFMQLWIMCLQLHLMHPGDNLSELLSRRKKAVRGLRSIVTRGAEKPKQQMWRAIQAFTKIKQITNLSCK